jgi:hypothetical protein
MKLPVIKQIIESNEFDEDYLDEAIEVLLCISEARGLKDEELEVIGELVSNISGAMDVMKDIKSGTPQKEALNGFMKRVLGSIDKK